jgi:glucarate dehydratase
MIISDLEFSRVQIGCTGRPAPIGSLVVRLATDAGLEGWGEANLPWRPAELPARRDALLPVLAGRSIFDVEELLTLEALASAPLRSAIEMASWDLIGQTARQPLCHLWGGDYRGRVPLAVQLGGDSPAETARMGRELAAQGFCTQVLTSRGSLPQDLELVAAVREAAQDRAELRFDAAAKYDVDSARNLCIELEDRGVQFVIDPLRGLELGQVASLRRQTSVPLCVWRPLRRPSDVLASVRCGAAQGVVIDLGRVGGIATARKCAAVAEAGGLATTLGAGASLGIALAAMLQLAAATPSLSGCHPCLYHQLQDDVLAESLEVIDGTVAVPRGPGLGVEVDRAKLEYYQLS